MICPVDVGCKPALDPNSATYINTLVSHDTTHSMSVNLQECAIPTSTCRPNSSFPTYYFHTGMGPQYTIICHVANHCTTLGNHNIVNIEDGAMGSCSIDHHAALVNVDTGEVWNIWQWDSLTGTHASGNCNPIPNSVSQNGQLHVGSVNYCTLANHGSCTRGGTAAGVTFPQAEWIDPREMMADIIAHPLSGASFCNHTTIFDWPAVNTDGTCATGPPEGALVWLDVPCATINKMNIPAYAKYIWCTEHLYGIRIVDSSETNPPDAVELFGWDDFTVSTWNPGVSYWGQFFKWCGAACPGANEPSHLDVPLGTLKTSNFHILPALKP